MARIYSPSQSHSCDYGVDFINGVAVVPDADTDVLAWFTSKGYTVVTGKDVLSPWDYLKAEELAMFSAYAGINPTGLTKLELVTQIESQLELMKIEITEFTAIDNVDGGTVAVPTYADAAAVIAALPVLVECDAGTVLVPVTTWVDTDTYDIETAGSYTFTATIGTLPVPYANTGAFTVTVEVIIAE
ncbi:MAG: hypothetical protein CVU95_00910 [Firmicutes bacterium HGW-Firmicutes-2]|jgi:hypothetical protein|nr:MAG: hypothetical protein CVU95_00910 [Firmicutes bacterium HGW-Firmicutes-2]